MKSIWILVVLTALAVTGCSGGNDPVNKDKDVPVPAKKDKS